MNEQDISALLKNWPVEGLKVLRVEDFEGGIKIIFEGPSDQQTENRGRNKNIPYNERKDKREYEVGILPGMEGRLDRG